jgi:hypothetical protein
MIIDLEARREILFKLFLTCHHVGGLDSFIKVIKFLL